jgi:ribonuclease HI
MTQKIDTLEIYTDGGARGNPGPAGIGVHAQPLFQLSEYIGETTNNVAEYTAAIRALEYLVNENIQVDNINFFLDSELVVKQIKGEYKVKQPHLSTLCLKVHQLLRQIPSSKISFRHVPRTQNKIADSLANQALDSHSK